MQLTGTTACQMRDVLLKARSNKKINLKQITERLAKIELPNWLQAEILQMVNYRMMERITCPVEQAMEAAVHIKIVEELVTL